MPASYVAFVFISAIAIVGCAKFDLSIEFRLSCTDSSCNKQDLDDFEFSLLQTALHLKSEPIKKGPPATPQQTPPKKDDIAEHSRAAERLAALQAPATLSGGAGQDAIIPQGFANLIPFFPREQTSSSSLLSNTSARMSDANSKSNLLFRPWTSSRGLLWNKNKNNKQTLVPIMTSASRNKMPRIVLIFIIIALLAVVLACIWDSRRSDSQAAGKAPEFPKRVGMGQSFFPPALLQFESPREASLGLQPQNRWYTTPDATPDHVPVPPMPKASSVINPTAPLSPEDQHRLLVPQSASSASIPQLCPALILPNNDPSLFKVSLGGLKGLQSSVGLDPVEIFGPSGRPLFHARCCNPASNPAVSKENNEKGTWLELSTSRTSRYPYATMGPLEDSNGWARNQSVQIYGPGGGRYGSLECVRGAWSVNYRGRPVFTLSGPGSDHLLYVNSPDGAHIGTLVKQSEWNGEVVVLQVIRGSDPILSLVCMLTILISSSDFW